MASPNNNDALLSSSVTHGVGAYHSAVVGASRAISNVNPTALVQVQPNMLPVQFQTIRLNTDLNHLPRDWAKTKFPSYNGFNRAHNNAFSSFTSVNLAHNYQDLVGRVDVISSSKNIKDLLKMTYQESPHISLMVHRLGKTLLLEEFDVHKNLIKKDVEDWQWLNDFFRKMNKQEDKNSSLALLNSPKKDPLSDEMYKNLIRHSISASVASNECISVENTNEVPRNIPHLEESQDLKGFHHESLWKFHDRSMLVDSDLPIFGTDSKCPCISLRLRDSPSINVLTGLDYWLDNLMSNVPEVAMVYHLNGFVQKYEILRTEDIPNIENSNFDPEEVMELARNMMAFIKSRAVMEGHTYWLYKSENDDMVKLYDLTEYCKNELHKDDNPFTVPVGLLCYRVGRNLKMSGQRRSADCRAMLENCLRLLNEENHPQICADAHLLLSDMWVPDKSLYDIWQGDGKIADPPDDLYDEDDSCVDDNRESENGFSQVETERNGIEEESNRISLKSMSLHDKRLSPKRSSPQKSPRKRDEKNEVALQELVVRGMIKRKAWDVLKVCRIAGETDERCREALKHIRKGLRCVDKDLARLSRPDSKGKHKSASPSQPTPVHSDHHQPGLSSSSVDVERDQIRVALPFVPIPLHYFPIDSKDDKSVENSNPASSNGQPSSSKDKEQKPLPNGSQSSEGGPQQTQGSEGMHNGLAHDPGVSQWHILLKLQLLRKAAVAFYILANQFHENLLKRGHTLRYTRYGLHCYECLFVPGPKRDPDVLESEIYFHLVHLVAKARACLDSNNWASSQKDFEELDEVEAAILHSAQAILQTPKESWIYTWPENEEKNLTTALSLFKRVLEMKVYKKKPLQLRKAIKNQLEVCIMECGNISVMQLKAKVDDGETFASIEHLVDKCNRAYDEPLSYFIKTNNKRAAGYCVLRIATVYELAAKALALHTDQKTNPISKLEYQIFDKMIEAYRKALTIYERDEGLDKESEEVYDLMRNKYFQLATRYFEVKVVTVEICKIAKDLLHKALKYCFLDSKSPSVKSSQRIAAICHFNLAIYSRMESKVGQNESLHRALHRKMLEHEQIAFGLYRLIKWARSQIMVKMFSIEELIEDFEKQTLTVKGQKKMIRNILLCCADLQPTLESIHTGQVDEEDDCMRIVSYLVGSKKILAILNKILMKWLKIEKSEVLKEVKQLYQRTLRQTSETTVEAIALPLSQILSDVRELLSSDRYNPN